MGWGEGAGVGRGGWGGAGRGWGGAGAGVSWGGGLVGGGWCSGLDPALAPGRACRAEAGWHRELGVGREAGTHKTSPSLG